MEFDLKDKTPDIRCLNDMKAVIQNQEWANKAPNLELYYMYRGLEEKNGLRYDITIIPANMLDKEFTKTKGHYHAGKYGEVYIVLEGNAIYLMQKENEQGEIEDVYYVKAQKGDVVIIPSHYGHVTINPSDKELKMANWISPECKSDYSLFEKMHGACYYYTKQGWVKNENYKNTPNLRIEEPEKSLPENLNFLVLG